jgi:hypothetical protein
MSTSNIALSAEQIKEKILSAKGNFVKAKWKSNPKPAAAFKAFQLEKITESVVRAGINFANLSSVKDAIAAGERGEVQSLPFGEWLSFPYLIKHRPKGSEEDVIYIRLYPSEGINHIPKSIYYVNGKEVQKEEFAKYLTPSDAKKLLDPSEKPLCFTIKSDNVLDIPQDVDE